MCYIRGDPHITTFDAQLYSFMGVGVYTLAKLDDLEVQGFLCPAMDGNTFKGVSYDVALAIKKGNSTLMIDEKNTVTLPDGSKMKSAQRTLSSDRAYEFLVERKLSDATGYYYWSVSTSDALLRMYSVPALSTIGTGDFAWLTLEHGNASLASGLCTRPCDCKDAACQTVEDADVLFDPETIARLSAACQVTEVPDVPCPDEKACQPGSEERKAAEAACEPVHTPTCTRKGMYDNCVVDYCSGWTSAVDAYVDGCKEDEAFRTPPPPPPSDEAICYVRGDPHITTLSGKRNEFMGVGVYTLARLDDLEIQAFMCPSMNGSDFLGVSYSVALAIQKGGSTLLIDEKSTVTLPDGTTMAATRKASSMDGAGPFSVQRELSKATGDWLWQIDVTDLLGLTAYSVPAKSTIGVSEFVWLRLKGQQVRSKAGGLCAQPCAASNGTCDNPDCKRVGSVKNIFDSTTLARLNAACQVADVPAPPCDQSKSCPPGSDKRKAAEKSCAPLDTPKCSKQGMHENCVVDYCAGWTDAAASYVDACYEDEALKWSPPPPPPPSDVETVACSVKGDPHITTYEGKLFDFMGVGAYSLAKLRNVEVQGFMCPLWDKKKDVPAFNGVSFLVAVAIRVGQTTVILDEWGRVLLPNGTRVLKEAHKQDLGLVANHLRVYSEPLSTSMVAAGRMSDKMSWQWHVEMLNNTGFNLGTVKVYQRNDGFFRFASGFGVVPDMAGSMWSWMALRGVHARKDATGVCKLPCKSPRGGCQNDGCQRVKDPDKSLFDSSTEARLNALCHVQVVQEPVCTATRQEDIKGAGQRACAPGSAEYNAALAPCRAELEKLRESRGLDCSDMYGFCATDHCISLKYGDTSTPLTYKKGCIENKRNEDPEAAHMRRGGDVDIAKAELDPASLFGSTEYCCNRCTDDANALCCPSRDAEGRRYLYRVTLPVPLMDNDFIEATLCPPCASDGTCIDGLRLNNIHTSGEPLSLLITNTSEYSPVWPGPVGHSDKLRVGYFYNGRKFDHKLADGILQFNLCSERLLKTSTCYVDAANAPVMMASATLRIFVTDMLGNSDPEQVGPKAVQFKCPGGTFSLFGPYHPYLAATAGDPVSIEKAFTVNGQDKITYSCPDSAPVTLWSRRNVMLPPNPSLSLIMEAATVLVNFAQTSCVDFTFANMPRTYRQQNFRDVKATEGGNPLNGSKPLAVSQFAGLETGACPAIYSPEHPMSRNWMLAVGDGGKNPGGDPW
jgi:hypothetical protein